jgi:uncharacterized protein (DUF2235 family)
MPKKIVLFSDGTGNSAAKARKTNVWRLYQALDQTTSDQIALYDDGVGTSSNKYLAILGGAFGWGLKRNVLDLYRFVCRNYKSGDQIYGFGFSRGAFTIRTLVGLIANEGLVVFHSEEQLRRDAAAAYRHYRSECFPSRSPIVLSLRWLRDRALWVKDWLKGYRNYDEIAEETKEEGQKGVHIRFLGLWDTVEAYGIPIKELKRGIDWVLWPMMFGNLKLSPLVERACHALSLDDERATFHPLVWDEVAEAEGVEAKEKELQRHRGRITQVWFAGAHSNVGGGYPDDRLSLVSLEWMMAEAMANGLPLDPDAVKQVCEAKSPFGKLYNSRAGLAAYYRYSPRRVPFPEYKGTEIRPIVHGAVVMRMAHGSDGYAPISLPRKFWVLGFDGKLVPMEGPSDRLQMDVTKRRAASAAITWHEPNTGRKKDADLRAAIGTFKSPAQDVISLVWDTVWWRRVLYAVTVLLTAILVLFPWLQEPFTSLFGALPFVSTAEASSRGFVAELVEALSGFLPGFARPWAEALQEHPVGFATLVVAILVSLYTSSWLQTRIHDRAWLSWHGGYRKDYLTWLRGNQSGWRKGMFAAVAFFGALLGLAIWQDWAQSTQRQLAFVTAAFALFLVWRLAEKARIGEPGTQEESTNIPHTFALSLARKLRKNGTLVSLYTWVFEQAVPIVFGVCVLVAIVVLANRTLFDAASAAGYYCKSSQKLEDKSAEFSSAAALGTFNTEDVCWETGIPLQKGQHYRITLTITEDWFDRITHTDAEGFPSHSLMQYLGVPLRRWWARNWFQPIARIGELGNDEYVLEPVNPPPRHVYCIDPASAQSPEVGLQPADCSSLEGTARQQACACKGCPKQALETEPPHCISSKITEGSAAELTRCSPTPVDRRKLIADIEAKSSGELFIYVNDAVVLPGLAQVFYRNNRGMAEVCAEPVSR